jgi:transglutaminase-like putative cysteine protease
MLAAAPLAAAQVPAAQAPPAGSESIYRLAVDPAAYKDDAAVYLLDEGVYRYDADGTGTRTLRMVVQILKESALARYREYSFSFNGATQRFTLNWMRVVKSDGEAITEAPAQMQDGTLPAALANPIYNDTKVKRVSLTGVAVGTIVDYSYTVETTKAYLAPDFLAAWSVMGTWPALRSHFVLDVPSAMRPHIEERNLNFKRQETTQGGRTQYVWNTTNVRLPKGEPFAADSDAVLMRVQVASPLTWAEIGKWFGDLAKDRYTLTPGVEAKINEIVAKARTLDDSVRAVHKWVAQDIRYVSISLGLGGFQPRTPAQVLETGFGDCKDKAMIFVAALKRIGVTAYPVLLSISGRADRSLPAIGQFNHAIAAVQLKSGGYQFVDLTAAYTPYGRLPRAEQGGFALVVHPDGRTEEVALPRDSLGVGRTELRLIGTVSDSGIFTGRYEEHRTGGTEEGMRSAFSTPLDSARRASISRTMASRYFSSASGDSAVAFDGKDFSAEPRLTIQLKQAHATAKSGDTEILNNPLNVGTASAAGAMQRSATQFLAADQSGPRKFPLAAGSVFGSDVETTTIEMTLPAGWRVRLPQNIDVANAFGRFRVTYAQNGRVFRMVRETSGARGSLAPERIDQLQAMMRAIASDDVRFFVIDKGGLSP